MTVAIVAAVWVVCGAITYAGTVGHFQREYPTIAHSTIWFDRGFGLAFAITGPVGFVCTSFSSGFFRHGFKL